jgi:hypothetical protein
MEQASRFRVRSLPFPLFPMADTDNSGMTAIVAIIAIVVVLGIGYVAYTRMAGTTPARSGGTSIDVNLPTGGGTPQQ